MSSGLMSLDKAVLTEALQADIDDQLEKALLDRVLTKGEKSTREYVEGALYDWGERRHLVGVIGGPPRTPSDTDMYESDYAAFCEWTIIQIEEYYDHQNQLIQMVMRQQWIVSPRLRGQTTKLNAESCMMSEASYYRYLRKIREQVGAKLLRRQPMKEIKHLQK